MKQLLLFLALVIAVVASSSSSLLLSNTLGNHMVLQRDRPATVWGFATAGVVVKTTFVGMTYAATAGADTVWRQALPAQPATSAPATISFTSSDGGVASLVDVLFGDVHTCSGQSNMRSPLASRHGPVLGFEPESNDGCQVQAIILSSCLSLYSATFFFTHPQRWWFLDFALGVSTLFQAVQMAMNAVILGNDAPQEVAVVSAYVVMAANYFDAVTGALMGCVSVMEIFIFRQIVWWPDG